MLKSAPGIHYTHWELVGGYLLEHAVSISYIEKVSE